jgi:hypothetical protein
LPPIAGLRHVLPCSKDFSWVFIATTSTSNTVLAWFSLCIVILTMIGTDFYRGYNKITEFRLLCA